MLIGRPDFEVETPILWPPDAKGWFIWKNPDAGKDWRQEKRVRWLDDITDSMDLSLGRLQELVLNMEAWHGAAHRISRIGHDWVTELNWTELLLGRKAMANIDCILKAEILLCQQMSTWSNLWFFLVVMYGCECWTITKAEHQRTDAFELWFWRKFLRILWTARKSKQSVLKEISTEYSLLKLKL